jgi:hypothetical protein
LTVDEIDEAIRIFINTNGNCTAVAKHFGMTTVWGVKLFKQDYVQDRMKASTLELVGRKKVAPIEECLERLSDIMRGYQFKHLVLRVKKAAKAKNQAAVVAAIDQITKYAPQIEGNQLKAINTLLTVQGALDPKRAAKDSDDNLSEEIAVALLKSAGSVEAIMDKIKEGKIENTEGSDPGGEE